MEQKETQLELPLIAPLNDSVRHAVRNWCISNGYDFNKGDHFPEVLWDKVKLFELGYIDACYYRYEVQDIVYTGFFAIKEDAKINVEAQTPAS